MNFNFSQQQQLLQSAVYESSCRLDKSLTFLEKWKHISQSGIIGITVDSNFGGSSLGALDQVLAFEALARGNSDNGLSFAIAAHTLACVIPLNIYGTPVQKQNYFPALINGDLIMANAMTESESGSDVFNMQSTASKSGDKYILNGIKTFISNSFYSRLVLVYASTNKDKGFFGGITAFLAEENTYSKGKIFTKMGLDSCSLGEIIFSDSGIPAVNILGQEGGGAVIFNHSMEWERICMAGIHLGAMQRVLEKTIDFVKQRKSSSQSISRYQSISHSVADMHAGLELAKNYTYKAAWMIDQKLPVGREASVVKLYVSNTVKDFMLKALQIFGGYGYITEFGIEQEVRDALAATIYSGTSEIQKNIIASYLGI
jgi:alkylation response protein AidB-like acyl-CoA dehydrogenase